MKIYNETITIEQVKILFTNRIFATTTNILESKNVLLINPWIKKSQILNFTKNNPLVNLLKDHFPSLENDILNNEKIALRLKEINELINFELLDFDHRTGKIIKDHFEVNDELITGEDLLKILLLIDQYAETTFNIILIGFSNFYKEILYTQFSKIKILIITNDFNLPFINKSNLELLVLDTSEGILEIINADSLLSWLELKTSTVLSSEDINNFFKSKVTMNTFKMQKALQGL